MMLFEVHLTIILLFSAYLDYLLGLKILWHAGYVHRDISTGNLLLCETDDGKLICKISDLEYARPQLVHEEEGSRQRGHKTVSVSTS